jgi:hypothetical protein
VVLDVRELAFDDEKEAKFAAHGIDVIEVQEVLELQPRFFVNRAARRASHVMVGSTRSGLLLAVPIEQWGESGVWRPATAFAATGELAARYRRHK